MCIGIVQNSGIVKLEFEERIGSFGSWDSGIVQIVEILLRTIPLSHYPTPQNTPGHYIPLSHYPTIPLSHSPRSPPLVKLHSIHPTFPLPQITLHPSIRHSSIPLSLYSTLHLVACMLSNYPNYPNYPDTHNTVLHSVHPGRIRGPWPHLRHADERHERGEVAG